MTTPSDQTPATQSTLCRCGHSLHEHSPYPEDDDLYLACEYDLCGCEDFEAAYCLTNLPAADAPPAGVAEQTQPAHETRGSIDLAIDAMRGDPESANYARLYRIERYIDALQSRLTAALKERDEMTARKDAAYEERNRVVAVVAHMALAMGFKAGLARTAIEGWSEDWHGCVYIELPCGQASWHYHDSQAALFADLPQYEATYDGHTTEQKYERLANWRPSLTAAEERERKLAEALREALGASVLAKDEILRAALLAGSKG